MSKVGHVAQPASGTTLDAIEAILNAGGFERLDIAVAYMARRCFKWVR